MKSKTADTDGTIIEFMQGSHSYDGIWFGEPHPILKGQFWWRTILREYLSSGKFHHPVPDEAGEVYVWVKAMERLPDIDNKNPKHYLFLNEVNHHAIDIWTEFITNFPPLITSRLFDWKWLSPAPPSVEDAGKGWISVEKEKLEKLYLIASFDSYNKCNSDENKFLSELESIIFPDTSPKP